MEKTGRSIRIQYFAVLREERGIGEEILKTAALTAGDLYEELRGKYHFRLPAERLRVSVNDQFCDWQTELKSGDCVVFIPPVAGGSILP